MYLRFFIFGVLFGSKLLISALDSSRRPPTLTSTASVSEIAEESAGNSTSALETGTKVSTRCFVSPLFVLSVVTFCF